MGDPAMAGTRRAQQVPLAAPLCLVVALLLPDNTPCCHLPTPVRRLQHLCGAAPGFLWSGCLHRWRGGGGGPGGGGLGCAVLRRLPSNAPPRTPAVRRVPLLARLCA